MHCTMHSMYYIVFLFHKTLSMLLTSKYFRDLAHAQALTHVEDLLKVNLEQNKRYYRGTSRVLSHHSREH